MKGGHNCITVNKYRQISLKFWIWFFIIISGKTSQHFGRNNFQNGNWFFQSDAFSS